MAVDTREPRPFPAVSRTAHDANRQSRTEPGVSHPANAPRTANRPQDFRLLTYNCPRDPQIAAWNREGAVPGEPGLALIIASGQGLFQRLDALQPVDPIYINRADGTRITFKRIGRAGTTAGASVS
jgi:hypothetical protein